MGIRLTKAFLFDFDGTLIDSEQAIYRCFQSITKQLAPKRLDYAKNILIGPPLRDTASEILGPDHQDLLDDFEQLFIQIHDQKVLENTRPYQNVTKILEILHEKKIPMAVATNKREAPTEKLIKYFNWNKYFQYIECTDSDIRGKRNKDEMIKKILHDKFFQNAYFIGDTLGDATSAKKNKLKFIFANYGYGKISDIKKNNISFIISNLSDILKIIDE